MSGGSGSCPGPGGSVARVGFGLGQGPPLGSRSRRDSQSRITARGRRGAAVGPFPRPTVTQQRPKSSIRAPQRRFRDSETHSATGPPHYLRSRGGSGAPAHPARRQPDRTVAAVVEREIRPAGTRDRAAQRRPPERAPACGGRPSPRAGQTRDLRAIAPRRRLTPQEDPGRSPRDRVRGDRHGRSGPGRSNQLPRVATRRVLRRHHPPAGPPSASGRRVGPPYRHRRK